MAEVDPGDDTIRRYVVEHHRFDPDRHERRNVLVAAYDSEREWALALERLRLDIERRREAGEEVDPREHVGGTVWEPGDRERAAYGHLLRRAFEHGVHPKEVDESRMPSNMGIMRVSKRPERGPLSRLIRSVSPAAADRARTASG